MRKCFSCKGCSEYKGLRQERIQCVQETAERPVWPERRDGGQRDATLHMTFHNPSSGTQVQWGQRDHREVKRGDSATLLAQVPELTAEGRTGTWNPRAADGFAGEADIQQGVPVLLFRARLHGDGRSCGEEGPGA